MKLAAVSFAFLVSVPCVSARGLRAELSHAASRSVELASDTDGEKSGINEDGIARTSVAELRRLEALEAAERETLLKQQSTLEALVAEQQELAEKQLELEAEQKRASDRLGHGLLEPVEHLLNDPVVVEVRTKAQSPLEMLIAAGFHLLLVAAFAVVYRQYRDDGELGASKNAQHDIRGGAFHYGLFDCSARTQLCLLACCCPSVRWADTISDEHVGMLPFWPALLVFEILLALSGATLCVTGLLLLLLVVMGRQKIRSEYGMESGCGTVVCDALIWSFCSCCAIVQEARQVDEFLPQ